MVMLVLASIDDLHRLIVIEAMCAIYVFTLHISRAQNIVPLTSYLSLDGARKQDRGDRIDPRKQERHHSIDSDFVAR